MFLILAPKLFLGQIIVIHDEKGVNYNTLILGSAGNAVLPNEESGQSDLSNLEFPVNIYTVGYKSITISTPLELSDTINLQPLSDSLDQVVVVSKQISDRESLFKIIQNTNENLNSKDIKYDDFNYWLLSASHDTVAVASGIVSRKRNSDTPEQIWPYYESIKALHFDSSEAELLAGMWPAPFLLVFNQNIVMQLQENLKPRGRNARITLDSIVPNYKMLKYYFKANITYDHLFSDDHIMNLTFSAQGSSLSSAILEKCDIFYPFSSKGLEAKMNISYQFSGDLGRFSYQSFSIRYLPEDKKCPSCQEFLELSSNTENNELNPDRQRTGYFSLWQSIKTFKRDSVFQQIVGYE